MGGSIATLFFCGKYCTMLSMPNTKGAKKAHRSSLRKRVFNIRRKSALHREVKTIQKLLQEGKRKEALAGLSSAYKAIDKAAKRGILKKNTASRKKSRLSRAVNKVL
jgi:small subunit ribosomal protein S20